MYKILLLIISCFTISICHCQELEIPTESELEHGTMEEFVNMDKTQQAVVTNVEVHGTDNNYTFKVTITSPDKDCNEYADWWEVFDDGGELIYRRLLPHSHADEQPFTKVGNSIKVGKNQFVYIRAHMNTTGYGSFAFAGTPEKGFQMEIIGEELFPELEDEQPQSKGCEY